MPSFVSRIFPVASIPLRWVLVVPFMVQTLGAVALVGYLSYRSGQQATANLANQLLQQTSERVSDRLTHYLETPQQVVAANQYAVQQGTLDLNDAEQLRRQLWQQMQLHPSLMSTGFFSDTGTALSYTRIGSKQEQQSAQKLTGQSVAIGAIALQQVESGQRQFSLVDNQGNAQRLFYQIQNDFRQLDWYRQSKQLKQNHWTPISAASVDPVLQMIAVAPVQDAGGRFQGLFTSVYGLATLSEYLHRVQFSPNGQILILERSGDLIANSVLADTRATAGVNAKAYRLLAVESQDERTREMARQLMQHVGHFDAMQQSHQTILTVAGQRQFVHIAPYHQPSGLDWHIVTVVPESDFMGEIHRNRNTTVVLCLLTLGASIASGVVIAQRVTARITRLSQASQSLAAGDLTQQLPSESLIAEVRGLAQSFNQMTTQLRQFFQDQVEVQATRQSEARFQQLAAAVPGMIYTYTQRPDGSYKFEYVSSFSQTILELEPAQIIANADTALEQIHPDDRPAYQAAATLSTATLEPFTLTYRNITPSGQLKWLEASSRPLRQAGGSTIWYGILLDISDRKQADQELRLAKEMADAANQAKSAFLAGMSHELRSPLNVILGFTQLMRQFPNQSQENREYLNLIANSGDYLLRLINQMLDLFKIESGKLQLEVQETDLLVLLELLHATFRLQCADKNLWMSLEIEADVPKYIQVDEQRLQQILMNLIGNAIKFTQCGGVRLRVAVEQGEKGKIWTREQGRPNLWLSFAVEDTGSGIAPEELDLIFDAFAQAAAGKRVLEGTGLGLTISQNLVQLMGGNMTAHSTPGRGSLFRFTLPVQKIKETIAPPEQRHRRISGLAPGQPTCRILVVDDHEQNRLLLNQILTKVGFEVMQAVGGEQAIALWQQWRPHLIFMDLQMPGMDGKAATQHIREMEMSQEVIAREQRLRKEDPFACPTWPVVVIALTAQAFESDHKLALATGCDDYIRKPFLLELLLNKIAQHLNLTYSYRE